MLDISMEIAIFFFFFWDCNFKEDYHVYLILLSFIFSCINLFNNNNKKKHKSYFRDWGLHSSEITTPIFRQLLV